MPLEIDLPEDHDQISLDEYIAALGENRFDLTCQADLLASAPLLKKLANNKDFLLDTIFAQLKQCLQFQQSNTYAPEVLMLHMTDAYFIRANIWKPVTFVEEQVPGYRFDVCHDHNFDILTVGYLGPGYRSRAYTYDRARCIGILGEHIDISTPADFTLREGMLALYRAKQDIHIQLPPERLSVSLNLIPKSDARHDVQFQIDEPSGTISRYLNFSGGEIAVRLAGLLGKEEHVDVLARLAHQHPNPKIRALSFVSQLQIDANQADDILDDVKLHQSPLVRHIVESEIVSYGACMRMVKAPEKSSSEDKALTKTEKEALSPVTD